MRPFTEGARNQTAEFKVSLLVNGAFEIISANVRIVCLTKARQLGATGKILSFNCSPF